jgi:hypothetical protein
MKMELSVSVFHSQSMIEWECDNGGQLWTPSVTAGYQNNGASLPSGFCTAGFSNLYYAFLFSLLIDLGFQVKRFRLKVYGGLTEILTGLHVFLNMEILKEDRALRRYERTLCRR